MTDYIIYIVKFLYRIRFWLVLTPAIVACVVYMKTANLPHIYTSTSTIYTGVISGFNILSESSQQVSTATQTSILDNLLNIIQSDKTLKNVSLRLYARSLVYGDPSKDNMYIKAVNYRNIYNHGKVIHHLIDKKSSNDSINEVNTYLNLLAYETNDPKNYVYGIYYYNLAYFCKKALKTIETSRDGKSDMLEVSYSTDDPGLAYQTLDILNDEFIIQYQELRFGETNNVIKYFEDELAAAAIRLRRAEDSLTDYSIEKRVINYEEETTQVAAQNTEYEFKYWEFLLNYNSSLKLIENLEARMGASAVLFRKNTNFLSLTNKISGLSNQITMLQMYENKTNSQVKIDSLKQELSLSEAEFHKFAEQYSDVKYTKEGVSNENVINEWLSQIILLEQSKSQLEVMKNRKSELDDKYVYFAPVGSTLKRKDREVNIAEREYFAFMAALNAARLRQKSLLMTSATLKIMNEPVYPLSSHPTNRKKIVIGASAGTLVFILFFFLLIELLDHTLHNKFRTELLTKGKAIGAFIRAGKLKSRKYNTLYNQAAAKTLGNTINTYFKPEKSNIINIISTEHHDGKTFVANQLMDYYTSMGMNVKLLSWHNDFSSDAKDFIQTLDLPDLDAKQTTKEQENVIIVEYPPLCDAPVTKELLQGVSLNLLVADSRRTWKNTDEAHYERLKEMAHNIPVFFVLNRTKRDAVEDFTGLLPPYTFSRRLLYRFSQLGITAKDEIIT